MGGAAAGGHSTGHSTAVADGDDDTGHRLVHFNTTRVAEHRFVSNRIRTSLYTLLNFIPLILIKEFSRLANVYFLIVVVLQFHPETTNTRGVPYTLPLLSLVVLFAAFLAAKQDLQRHRADSAANKAQTRRFNRQTGAFEDVLWVDVKVGDLIKVQNYESLPADLLLVSSFEPDPSRPAGSCFIETKSLDGETNLKGRSVPHHLAIACGGTEAAQTEALSRLSGYVKCETPNAATRKFVGSLQVRYAGVPAESVSEEQLVLSINNMLLRGSTLRNCEYIIGLVINTGVDTKVMQGARKPPLKRSYIERATSYMIVAIFLTMIILCFIATTAQIVIRQGGIIADSWYLQVVFGEHPTKGVVIDYLRVFVLLANFVSVSLNASIDLNKFVVARVIEANERMWHPESVTKCKVRTAELIDELGMISHVFSDKTGTLTQNVMQFRKCSINGVSYGSGTTEIGRARLMRLGMVQPNAPTVKVVGGHEGSSSQMAAYADGDGDDGRGAANMSAVNFEGAELFGALEGQFGEGQRRACVDFFTILALCHSVVVEELNGTKRLSASSPDEAALVEAAKHFGIEFLKREHGKVTILDHRASSSSSSSSSSSLPSSRAVERTVEVLEVLEFSSARKRMSVVVSDPQTHELRLLTKGADNVMLPRLSDSTADLRAATEAHLHEHAEDGLRTLVVAAKPLERAAYEAWSVRYRLALTDIRALERREAEQPNVIDDLVDELEVGLQLCGSTAIEDKLQSGVPRAVADLDRAGIACWVLTGDKEETAINIAFACELFARNTSLHVFNSKSHPSIKSVVMEMEKAASVVEREGAASGSRHGIVIDGEIISLVMASPAAQLALLKLSRRCHSLVACRCAPSQKAQLVLLVKNNVEGAVTLAIGDGANDVAMIQAAHVGVGISGQEGMQAANSADFSFGQFRFLLELLLVHGRNSYRRMATLVCYLFYKSIALTLVVFWYLVYNASTGQKIYLEGAYATFNFFFTGVAIVIYAFTDCDVSHEAARDFPQLYHLGVRKHYFNRRVVSSWALGALIESTIIFFVITSAIDKMGSMHDTPGVWQIGDYAFAVVMVIVTGKLALVAHQVSYWLHITLALNLALWWLLSYLANMEWVTSNDLLFSLAEGYLGMFAQTQSSTTYWLLLVFFPAALLLPQYAWQAYQRFFQPLFRDLVIEASFHADAAQLECLKQYSIPPAERDMPLRKDAPRPVELPTGLRACLPQTRAKRLEEV